jgi:hypothetical protein
MNEKYAVKGCVRRLEQRKQRKQLRDNPDPLSQTLDLWSFDVEFSLSGKVLQKTSYTYGGAVYRSTRFEYDEAERLIRTTNFASTGVGLASSELAYTDGKCTWINRDATGVVTSRGVDEYNGEHLTLMSSFDDHDRPKTVKSFEYLDNKLAKSDSRYFLPDGTWYERWLTDYDSQGRVLRTHGLKADGSPLGDGKYLHEYDEEGRLSKLWTFSEFDDDNIASNVTIYQYVNDERGNWIERCEFHLWRNDSYQSKTTTTRMLTYYP